LQANFNGQAMSARLTAATIQIPQVLEMSFQGDVTLTATGFTGKFPTNHFQLGQLLSIEDIWALECVAGQKLALSTENSTIQLFGVTIPTPGKAELNLDAQGQLSVQVESKSTLTVLPNLFEIDVHKISLTKTSSDSRLEVSGTVRSLQDFDGNWLLNKDLTITANGPFFETETLANDLKLLSSGGSGLDISAGIKFGYNAQGYFVGLTDMKFWGQAIASQQALQVYADGNFKAGWKDPKTFDLPPFQLNVPTCDLVGNLVDHTLAIAIPASTLQFFSGTWPKGSTSLPAIDIKVGDKSSQILATFNGSDSRWHGPVAGLIEYRLNKPVILADLMIGPSGILVNSLKLNAGSIDLQTVAKRPNTEIPWASSSTQFPQCDINMDGSLNMPLPALQSTDLFADSRAACEQTAHNNHKLPTLPGDPPPKPPHYDDLPPYLKKHYDDLLDTYNKAVNAYNSAVAALNDALTNCSTLNPLPPSSFQAQTVSVNVSDIVTLG
jgi:hypothetical protein